MVLAFCPIVSGNPYQYVQPLVVRQKVVEFDADTYLGTYGYYSVGEKLKAEKLSAEDAENAYLRGKIDALREELDRLRGVKPNGDVPLPNNPEVPEDDPVLILENKVLDIFTRYNCIKCHVNPQNGVVLVKDGKLADLDVFARRDVYYRSEGSHLENGDVRMPKGAPPMKDEDVNILFSYLMQAKPVK